MDGLPASQRPVTNAEIGEMIRNLDLQKLSANHEDSDPLYELICLFASGARRKNFYRLLTNDGCTHRHGILEPELLEDGCPLDNGRHDDPEATSRTAVSSIGLLNLLPLELLHGILLDELDLAALTTLRSVSRGLRLVVDSLPQYHSIVTHAPNSLRAAISLEIASSVSCRKLYTELCSDVCRGCGKFGAYLYLLTCSRVCYICFTEDTKFMPMTKQHSKIFWGVTSRDLASGGITVARSLPGRYQPYSMVSQGSRVQLVDLFTAGDIAFDLYDGSPEDMFLDSHNGEQARLAKWRRRVRQWENTPENERARQRPSRPPYSDWRDGKTSNTNRFMCVVGFPSLNRTFGVVDWGVGCLGCHNAWRCCSTEGYNDDWKERFRTQELFQREVDNILGPEKLLPWSRFICHVAGDPSSKEPSLSPCAVESEALNRRRRLEILKPVRRPRKRPSQAASGNAAVEST